MTTSLHAHSIALFPDDDEQPLAVNARWNPHSPHRVALDIGPVTLYLTEAQAVRLTVDIAHAIVAAKEAYEDEQVEQAAARPTPADEVQAVVDAVHQQADTRLAIMHAVPSNDDERF